MVEDKSQPQTRKIYVMLERSAHQIEDAGYVPDTNSVLYNVEEEQKEQSLLP